MGTWTDGVEDGGEDGKIVSIIVGCILGPLVGLVDGDALDDTEGRPEGFGDDSNDGPIVGEVELGCAIEVDGTQVEGSRLGEGEGTYVGEQVPVDGLHSENQ